MTKNQTWLSRENIFLDYLGLTFFKKGEIWIITALFLCKRDRTGKYWLKICLTFQLSYSLGIIGDLGAQIVGADLGKDVLNERKQTRTEKNQRRKVRNFLFVCFSGRPFLLSFVPTCEETRCLKVS